MNTIQKLYDRELENPTDVNAEELLVLYDGINNQVTKLKQTLSKSAQTCKKTSYMGKNCENQSIASLKRLEKFIAELNSLSDSIDEVKDSLKYWKANASNDPEILKNIKAFKRRLKAILNSMEKYGWNASILRQMNTLENGRYVKNLNKLIT